jgi:preprotein translocase subunit SecD
VNRYPLWKYLLLVVVVAIGFVYALPNVFGDDPAIQVSAANVRASVDQALETQVSDLLKGQDLQVKAVGRDEHGLLVRLYSIDDQLKAKDLIKQTLGDDYTVALNLAPAAPAWLAGINARPMYLGLDLRGGLHF